jgi:hypothetical protein
MLGELVHMEPQLWWRERPPRSECLPRLWRRAKSFSMSPLCSYLFKINQSREKQGSELLNEEPDGDIPEQFSLEPVVESIKSTLKY